MPVVPIETPSETEIVLNSIGVPPAARMPVLHVHARARAGSGCTASSRSSVVATPTSGFARSSSVKPTAFSIARAGGAVDAVGEGGAAALGRDRTAASRRSCGGRLRGRRCAGAGRGRRAGGPRGSAATAAASSFSAQTTTDGPEPESVTPAAPRHRVRAQLVEQRRVRGAVRLVQPVVERAREQRRRRRRRSPRRAARPARRAAAASACGSDAGSRDARLPRVHARVRHDDDRRERQVGREPRARA